MYEKTREIWEVTDKYGKSFKAADLTSSDKVRIRSQGGDYILLNRERTVKGAKYDLKDCYLPGELAEIVEVPNESFRRWLLLNAVEPKKIVGRLYYYGYDVAEQFRKTQPPKNIDEIGVKAPEVMERLNINPYQLAWLLKSGKLDLLGKYSVWEGKRKKMIRYISKESFEKYIGAL